MRKTFKTIKAVQFFFDKECTGEIQNGKHDLRVYPNYKGVIVNKLGGVFGMAYTSGKNNINKVVSCVSGANNPSNEYYYSIVCEGQTAYFKLNVNLYLFDEVEDGVKYEDLIPVKEKPNKFDTMKRVQELSDMDNISPLDYGINPSY